MPAFMRGAVSIPDHSRLLRELRLLERRTSPSGKDSIDHGKGGSDDYANSLCGCIAITLKEPREGLALLGLGGKCYKDGALVTDGVTAAIREPKPPSALPPSLANIELDATAQARLEAFKKDFDARRQSASQFVGKFFNNGAGR